MTLVVDQSQVPAAVEGFSDWDLDAFLWGDWHGDDLVGDYRSSAQSSP
jgi:5-methyltetrahydropteroyltriglutamate--homocysteine methyltransferase